MQVTVKRVLVAFALTATIMLFGWWGIHKSIESTDMFRAAVRYLAEVGMPAEHGSPRIGYGQFSYRTSGITGRAEIVVVVPGESRSNSSHAALVLKKNLGEWCVEAANLFFAGSDDPVRTEGNCKNNRGQTTVPETSQGLR